MGRWICARVRRDSCYLTADTEQMSRALIGGSLAKPHDHFPSLFRGQIWVDHPFFLPCLTLSCCSLLGCVITLLYLKEVCRFLLFQQYEILKFVLTNRPFLLVSLGNGVWVILELMMICHSPCFRLLQRVTSHYR